MVEQIAVVAVHARDQLITPSDLFCWAIVWRVEG